MDWDRHKAREREFDCFAAVGGLCDYGDVGLEFEEGGESSAEHGLVFGEENADFCGQTSPPGLKPCLYQVTNVRAEARTLQSNFNRNCKRRSRFAAGMTT